MKVVLRRNQSTDASVRVGHLSIDTKRQAVFAGEKKVDLTRQEYALLESLIKHKNQTLTREQLLQMAWGLDYEGELRTVDVHVRRLREKLDLQNEIVTVYKVGYRLEI